MHTPLIIVTWHEMFITLAPSVGMVLFSLCLLPFEIASWFVSYRDKQRKVNINVYCSLCCKCVKMWVSNWPVQKYVAPASELVANENGL